MFLLEFFRKRLDAMHLPTVAYWYSEHVISIQFVLLAMLTAIFVRFRSGFTIFGGGSLDRISLPSTAGTQARSRVNVDGTRAPPCQHP
jgi:hypothetical protein